MDEITLAEAARRTGVSAATLRQWAWQGRIPATKLGRDWIVLLADVQRYITEHGVKPRRPHKKRRGKADT
jgi:excisionase family DNA binding protein